MSNKAFGNGYGEIEWITMSGALEQELKKREPGKEKIAHWHWGKERYISYPETIEQIEHVQRLLKKHQVGLRENKKFDWLNTSPTELIDQVRKQRSEMSIADKYRGDLPRRLSFAPSEFQLAGSLYAFHTRRCIIADSYAEDRRVEALKKMTLMPMQKCEKTLASKWCEREKTVYTPPFYSILLNEKSRAGGAVKRKRQDGNGENTIFPAPYWIKVSLLFLLPRRCAKRP